jgi:hypothetical protein
MSLFTSNRKEKNVNSPDTAQPCPVSCNEWTVAGTAPMAKAEIIAELENMVAARLFSRQPWLADRETISAVHRKLIEMGLVDVDWGISPLGKELDVELFEVFMGLFAEWEVPIILEHYRLIDDAECDAIYARMEDADAGTVLPEYVKRAYFDYRKASKSLH